MTIVFQGHEVIIPIDKAILALTRAQFIEALKRGKAYRRRAALQARLAPQEADRLERHSQAAYE